MNTLAKRLQAALDKLGISQSEAARRCGISQQSLNYIISKNLNHSKLAPQISTALDINPEWLIYGEGRFQEVKIFEIPILESPYILMKFINNDLDLDNIKFTFSDIDLGNYGFGYLTEPTKLVICTDLSLVRYNNLGYLCLNNNNILISEDPNDLAFSIFEWRTRCDKF